MVVVDGAGVSEVDLLVTVVSVIVGAIVRLGFTVVACIIGLILDHSYVIFWQAFVAARVSTGLVGGSRAGSVRRGGVSISMIIAVSVSVVAVVAVVAVSGIRKILVPAVMSVLVAVSVVSGLMGTTGTVSRNRRLVAAGAVILEDPSLFVSCSVSTLAFHVTYMSTVKTNGTSAS